ncbi:unnamed protein product [Tuber melanosporum]|uniref:(Perigord truffle) hypothetical protein n=1 Tax=Tuber melanosporum (strain Mel28) TaxID=656061 RepID=D5G509_TUBMM|nr:uncharacterized protein GSTUM_00000231001 [Tuber melanosporum]CAZ79602.1 unnamed protein product [Tuber melanosporum]
MHEILVPPSGNSASLHTTLAENSSYPTYIIQRGPSAKNLSCNKRLRLQGYRLMMGNRKGGQRVEVLQKKFSIRTVHDSIEQSKQNRPYPGSRALLSGRKSPRTLLIAIWGNPR